MLRPERQKYCGESKCFTDITFSVALNWTNIDFHERKIPSGISFKDHFLQVFLNFKLISSKYYSKFPLVSFPLSPIPQRFPLKGIIREKKMTTASLCNDFSFQDNLSFQHVLDQYPDERRSVGG